MELYVNTDWTERYENAYIAEAVAWSDNGNHATIYTVGITADEANAKLIGALRELGLMPRASMKERPLFPSMFEKARTRKPGS